MARLAIVANWFRLQVERQINKCSLNPGSDLDMTASVYAPTKRALSPSADAADAPYYHPLAGPPPKKARKVKLAEGEEPQPEPEKRQAIFKKCKSVPCCQRSWP